MVKDRGVNCLSDPDADIEVDDLKVDAKILSLLDRRRSDYITGSLGGMSAMLAENVSHFKPRSGI